MDKPTRVPSLDEFPEDVQDFMYDLFAKALLRAYQNGQITATAEEIAAARAEYERGDWK